MANSSCPKCGKHAFELVTTHISGSNYKYNFVQCSAYGCGTVVGVVDYFHTGTKLDKIQEAVDSNKSSSSSGQIQNMMQNMHVLHQNLVVLSRKLDILLEQTKPTDASPDASE